MVEVKGLRKAYGSTVAVDDASLSIPKGVCYGLLGPNGAGKTTMISIATGTLDADQGEVKLEGEPVGMHRLAIKRRIGYVPQDLALYDELSALDNLRFFGALYGLSGAELEKRVDYGIDIAGLQDRRKGAVKSFSGGMKRRLNIAAALLHDPDFLVLDEPTVGVDPQSRNLIFETLETLRLQGKTILYTTHYMEEVERLCNRVAIMDCGKVIAEGDLSSLHALVPAKRQVLIQMELDSVPRLDGLPSEWKAKSEGHTLSLELEDLTRDLPTALIELAARGAVIVDVRSEQPSLEEVFLHLTGKKLRD